MSKFCFGLIFWCFINEFDNKKDRKSISFLSLQCKLSYAGTVPALQITFLYITSYTVFPFSVPMHSQFRMKQWSPKWCSICRFVTDSYFHTCALSSSSCAFTFVFIFHAACVKGMPFGACHDRMHQPVHTCASVVVQLLTSVRWEYLMLLC
jgi:hypothetical protein